MLTKEKVILDIQAMPENEFQDIDVLLKRIVSRENDAEMMAHIDKKLNETTDPETIFLIKKIKRGIEDSKAGRGITVEEMEKKVQGWFK